MSIIKFFFIVLCVNLSNAQINFQENIIDSNIMDGPKAIYAADLDGDGDMDVLSASSSNNKITWYENTDGQGSFGIQHIITTTAETVQSVFAIDLDGDGDLDVLSASQSDNTIAWYENTNGLGAFGGKNVISSNADTAKSVYATDIDGDGDMDVLSASFNDDKVAWYENVDGLGNFGSENIITTSANGAQSVYAADLDGDGDMDVLSASFNDYKINWYENTDGQGFFGLPRVIVGTPNDFKTCVFSADFDGDGDMDVLSSSWQGSKRIAWYENTDGQGNFSVENVITNNVANATSIFASDIDNDGDMDVISASQTDDKIAWYENTDGQGSFGVLQSISTNADGAQSVFAADINGDGAMDIVAASYSDHKISWFKNLAILNNEISGNLKLDVNSNGCDNNDISAANLLIKTSDGTNTLSTFSANNGNYKLFPGEGTFTTEIVQLPAHYISSPITQTSTFVGLGNTDNANFCLQPVDVINDLSIAVYPIINDPRPGFDTSYQLVYRNLGTTQLNGDVLFQFNSDKIQFLGASEPVDTQTANTLSFNFSNLNPFEIRTIDLDFNVFPPPTTSNGDVLIFTATVNPVVGDITEEDNVFQLEQTVVGSYDPNDISVLEGEEIYLDEADNYLHYIIRFQNTGTASAINVRIKNVLDANLDWATIQLENISHTSRVEITNESNVEFIFENINLPDSTSNEPESHGYIQYKIKPISAINIGDSMSNSANIFFDFNPPVLTNTVTTTIVEFVPVEASEPANLQICNEENFDVFDLTQNSEAILGTLDPNNHEISFHISQSDANNDLNPIVNSSSYTNTSNPQAIYARLERITDREFDTTNFDLIVDLQPEILPITDLIVSDVDNDGFETFDLTIKIPEILGAQTGIDITFYETEIDALNGINQIVLPEAYINITNPQEIFARLVNLTTSCISVNSFNIFAEPVLGMEDLDFKSIKIFPNPGESTIYISSNIPIIGLNVFNQLGQIILSLENKKGINSFSIDQFSKDVYILKLIDENSNVIIKKMIKN
ncbi:FG-GAP-like repeat-containing protein [Aequorivita sp. CIP111184]|uniref:FG-GAP-like repeat-containing protein n=1 Tax=Aequorivita sp. CIP111184 TaxID=2211356 RepID=UPI000DBBE654|nr:FG-GAP-like repeat-containing protein [Aequorivita sp. CIP111184]SRX52759.1 hypothetical protein AEQU1_00629 [Aequorivita sp. CIP111184]